MNSRPYPNLMRRIATVAAIILLLGQAIAAAHFHRTSQREFSADGVAGIADSSCPICAAHFHSPAASAGVPTLDAPTMVERIVIRAARAGTLSTFTRSRFGRAPPRSV
jgi:hypothetical protein